ncbi:MAG: G8 domain-containing protein, partial [Chloroflexota bacterium]
MNKKQKLGLTGSVALAIMGVSSMAFVGNSPLYDVQPAMAHVMMEDHGHAMSEHTMESDLHSGHNMQPEHDMSDVSHQMHHTPSIHKPENASHTAITSGNWSSASTWQNGSIPAAGDTIAIPQDIVVTVDGKVAPKYKSIAIDGALRFATDVNTELWVDTITSSMTGRLEIGTQANPIDANVTARIVFVDNGLIDRNADPKQVGRGAVLSGPVEVVGAQKTHRITAGTFPKAGDSELVLSSVPTGWRVGDQLIITGSQGKTSDEVRTITAINGATILLDKPLSLDHVPPKADLNLWIANSSRNVIFESENLEVRHRGHMMFMHQLDVQIHNARFYGLGRTDKTIELDDFEYELLDTAANDGPSPIDFTVVEGPANNIRGRYAIHFHRGGTAPGTIPAVIKGSVVEDSPGWGFVNHSSNVDMVDNVSYNIQGAGFYTEAGDEVGSMVGNIAIRTVNSAFRLDDEGAIDPDLGLERGDFGNDGDGFWLSGTRVAVIDNVAAGASAHGIIFWVDGLIEPDTGRAKVKVSEIENGHLISNRDTIPVWWAPMAEVRDNESYGAT